MGCLTRGKARMLGIVLPVAVLAFGFLLSGNLVAGVPNDVCANCHDISETFHMTSHGTYFADDPDMAANSCEACHGDGVDHANEGDPALIINPAKVDQF